MRRSCESRQKLFGTVGQGCTASHKLSGGLWQSCGFRHKKIDTMRQKCGSRRKLKQLTKFLFLSDKNVTLDKTFFKPGRFVVHLRSLLSLLDKIVILATKFVALWYKKLSQFTNLSTIRHDVVMRVSIFVILRIQNFFQLTKFLSSFDKIVITASFLWALWDKIVTNPTNFLTL